METKAIMLANPYTYKFLKGLTHSAFCCQRNCGRCLKHLGGRAKTKPHRLLPSKCTGQVRKEKQHQQAKSVCWKQLHASSDQCTMHLALKKMMNLAPIFSCQIYFRWKYLGVFSFAVSLSIHIWGYKLKTACFRSWNCLRISCNSTRMRKGTQRIEGTSWT